MTGKKYSAGAIFLQVVPVFANVQRAIEDEAKNIDRALGDQMEKSGDEAGRRAGKAASKSMGEELKKGSGAFERDFRKNVDEINNALNGIDTKKLGNALRKELTQVKKDLAGLKKIDLTAETDFKKAYADIAVLEGRTRAIRDNAKIVFRTDIDNALRGFSKLAAAKEKIDDPVEIEVSADFKHVEREMGTFEKKVKKVAAQAAGHLKGSLSPELRRIRQQLEELGALDVGVDISANRMRFELTELERRLDRLSDSSPEVDARFDAGQAMSELAAFNIALERIDGKDVNVDVDVRGTNQAKAKLSSLIATGDTAANTFRSFNGVMFAAAALGPALVPILGAIAGGLLAIGPAAAIAALGIASVMIGFSGIGDALSALKAQDEQAASGAQTAGRQRENAARGIASAQRAVADAARGVEDAERNAARAARDAAEAVRDARERAADGIEDALERQKDAQEAYRDAVRDVRDAERELAEARRNAAGTGENLDMEIRGNDLALDQAMLNSFNATVTYNSVMADGSATNAEQEQARIDREEALLRLEELRKKAKELAKEKRKWDRDGVEGTDAVKSAQEQLNDAMKEQKEAYEGVRDAAEAVDEARTEGIEMVADALRDQNETLADNKRAIEDARRALADAKRGLGEAKMASDDLNSSIDAQQLAVDNAMGALGPAGQKFARFLHGLRDEFAAFRDDIQAVMLPPIMEAISSFFDSKSGSELRKLMISLAGGFGEFVLALSKSFQGPVWLEFFETLNAIAPRIMSAYGGAFISFLEAMASIMTALAPSAVLFAEGLAKLADRFAKWAASEEGQKSIQKFMGYVVEITPKVLKFVSALSAAFTNLSAALAPYASMALDGLTAFLDYIGGMDTKVLGAVVSSILTLIIASQAAYTVTSALVSGLTLLSSPVGIAVFAIVALSIALVALYNSNEKFRKFVDESWPKIAAAMEKAWERMKPGLEELKNVLILLWEEILGPFLAWLGPLWVRYAEKVIPLMGKVFGLIAKAISNYIKMMIGIIKGLVKIFQVVASVVTWLWKKIFSPVLGFIVKAWKTTFNTLKYVWTKILWPVFKIIGEIVIKLWKKWFAPHLWLIQKGWEKMVSALKKVWEKHLKPVFDHIREKALPKLKSGFETAIDGIKKAWDGLKRVIATPIKFVLETVINKGLVPGINKIAKWAGVKSRMEPAPIPGWMQSYKTGGVMPGYTPGRDPHKFISPTGGRLELSGGEAIMRPEFTATVGKGWVDHMNAAARKKGRRGVQEALQGGGHGRHQAYWMGGVVPLDYMTSVSQHTSGYSHPWAGDLNGSMDLADPPAPVRAWKAGRVAHIYHGYGDSHGRYGNHVMLDHGNQASLYAHLSSITASLGSQVGAGAMLGRVGETGRAYGAHLHFEIRGAQPDWGDSKVKGGGRSVPGFIKSLLQNPVDVIGGFMTSKFGSASEFVKNSPMTPILRGIPTTLAKGMKDKVLDLLPSWADIGKAGSKGLDNMKDGPRGLLTNSRMASDDSSSEIAAAHGGVLPYNGAMKYDNGGYLAPGLTSVVNLTGKPEPVFTNDQWGQMKGGTGEGGSIHYEPHFEGSNLGPEDVAADLNFQMRRMARRGRYQGV